MPISSGVTKAFGITHGNFTNLPIMLSLCLLLEILAFGFVQRGVISNRTITQVAQMQVDKDNVEARKVMDVIDSDDESDNVLVVDSYDALKNSVVVI